MHIFLSFPHGNKKRKKIFQTIFHILKKFRARISTQFGPEKISAYSEEELNWLRRRHCMELEGMNGLIIDVSDLCEETFFTIAEGVTLNRPLLCIYQKKKPLELIKRLKACHGQNRVALKSWSDEKKLEKIIHDFISDYKDQFDQEFPTIPITIPVTPSMDHCLNQWSKDQQCSKGDTIRALIEKKIAAQG